MVYPTILNVYGGPEVQTVSNSFKGMRQLRMHMLASQGYCVVCIDSRGSRHRGVQFESHLRRRLGTVELADQVEVFRILAKQLGYIDLNRVAIHGWSYGKKFLGKTFIQSYIYAIFRRLLKLNGTCAVPGTLQSCNSRSAR